MLSLEKPFQEFLAEVTRGASVLVTTHRAADVDGVASAAALGFLVRELRPDVSVEVLLPDKPKKEVRKLAVKLAIHTLETGTRQSFQAVACVDVGSLSLLSEEVLEMLRKAETTLLIDHHVGSQGKAFKHAIVVEWSSSSEIVAYLLDALKVVPNVDLVNSLLVGILADTKDLKLASARTFRLVARLIEWGASVETAKSLLEGVPEISERIAILKSLSRAKLLRAGNLIVVVSRLASYQARAAEALVRLGADIAIVGGRGDSLTRVHMRAAQRLVRSCPLNLVEEVVKPVLDELGGHGGGHRLAAALETAASPNKTLSVVERVLREVLAEKCGAVLKGMG